jgi:hypothetical protein
VNRGGLFRGIFSSCIVRGRGSTSHTKQAAPVQHYACQCVNLIIVQPGLPGREISSVLCDREIGFIASKQPKIYSRQIQ